MDVLLGCGQDGAGSGVAFFARTFACTRQALSKMLMGCLVKVRTAMLFFDFVAASKCCIPVLRVQSLAGGMCILNLPLHPSSRTSLMVCYLPRDGSTIDW